METKKFIFVINKNAEKRMKNNAKELGLSSASYLRLLIGGKIMKKRKTASYGKRRKGRRMFSCD